MSYPSAKGESFGLALLAKGISLPPAGFGVREMPDFALGWLGIKIIIRLLDISFSLWDLWKVGKRLTPAAGTSLFHKLSFEEEKCSSLSSADLRSNPPGGWLISNVRLQWNADS
jgi:hypothetical protein